MVHVILDVLREHFANAPIQGTLEVAAYYYMVGS
jgi:hypothetical protein